MSESLIGVDPTVAGASMRTGKTAPPMTDEISQRVVEAGVGNATVAQSSNLSLEVTEEPEVVSAADYDEAMALLSDETGDETTTEAGEESVTEVTTETFTGGDGGALGAPVSVQTEPQSGDFGVAPSTQSGLL